MRTSIYLTGVDDRSAMTSFLITFKPATESPERGWPLRELQKLVKRQLAGERVQTDWRFINRKAVSSGDRFFLLQQGRGGPAIIGYGTVLKPPTESDGAVVEFESLVDPVTELLADREDLQSIPQGRRWWRSQASGVLLPNGVARELENLVVGKGPRSRTGESEGNPDWTRDELIIALNFYLNHRPNPPGKGTPEISELSSILNQLGKRLFQNRASTFRNENGVYMKLMNFRRLDPDYTSGGKVGLSRGAKADKEVWDDFAIDPPRCQRVSNAIIAGLKELGDNTWTQSETDTGIEEAPEGRLLTRIHIARERNRKLIESKRKHILKKHGKLACEACGFDFGVNYGERGRDFIECHHVTPVESIAEGQITHINDLALVCANCHRIIHRYRPWITVAAVKALMESARRSTAAQTKKVAAGDA